MKVVLNNEKASVFDIFSNLSVLELEIVSSECNSINSLLPSILKKLLLRCKIAS